ncbi:MAG TPA: hypothetical protein VD971_05725 [Phycisphaerales bacterium]|nr:hypothetical protein [Phycisphaerales bacterium]
MNALRTRWKSLSFVMKAVVAGAATLVVYFLVVEPVVTNVSTWNMRAEGDEAKLRDYAKEETRLKAAQNDVNLGTLRFGELAPPGDAQTRPLEFGEALDAILRRHSITDVTASTRTKPMPAGPLAKHYEATHRVEAHVRELTFTATPENFAAALADVERSPLVANISRLQIRQGDPEQLTERLLRVNMSVETWVLEKKEKGRT